MNKFPCLDEGVVHVVRRTVVSLLRIALVSSSFAFCMVRGGGTAHEPPRAALSHLVGKGSSVAARQRPEFISNSVSVGPSSCSFAKSTTRIQPAHTGASCRLILAEVFSGNALNVYLTFSRWSSTKPRSREGIW